MLVIRELDNARIAFEAAAYRVGNTNTAARAMARALNHEGRKALTQVKRALRDQTGAKYSTVSKAVTIRTAHASRLSFHIVAKGETLSLKEFRPRQFSFGVRAKPWGRVQRFEHAFMPRSLDGHAFVRTADDRLPIKKLWGPAIPKEMVKDATLEAFESSTNGIADRAQHELLRLLDGH